jgi:hypothetical protein
VTVATATRESRAGAGLRRLLSALPLAVLFGAFAGLYLWQGTRLVSPWTFYDELYYTRLARSVVGDDSLNLALTNAPPVLTKLYALLTAPAWLFDSNSTAYDTVKALGALLMTATIFPAYALARTVVSRPLALFAAAGTVAVPALTYSSQVMEESVAYPYAALCFLLMSKALTTRRWPWIAGVIVACVAAPFVRRELGVLPATFAAAAALYGVTSTTGRRRWSRERWPVRAALLGGAVALAALAILVLSRVSGEWSAAVHHPGAAFRHLASAAGALVIGAGFIPAVAALALLCGSVGWLGSARRRAFVCILLANLVAFLVYTGVKTAFLSAIRFDNPVTERNLIYLVPLLFVAAALWLETGSDRIVPVVAAAAVVGAAVLSIPLSFPAFPASHAPSFAVLAKLHAWGWTRTEIRIALVVAVTVAALVLLIVPRLRRRPGSLGRVAVAVVCSAVLAWALAAELEASATASSYARVTTAGLPRPLDWLDRATNGERAIYIGQRVSPRNEVLSLEFWNRSLEGLFRLDTARGHELVPVTLGRTATFPVSTGARFVVADHGITPVGRSVLRRGRWTVYAVRPPVRLATAVRGVYGDGWMGKAATYWHYGRGGTGTARVSLSTTLACRVPQPATVTVTASALTGPPRRATRRETLGSCETRAIDVPATLPFRLDVAIDRTFVPSRTIPGSTDPRRLTAQVRFSWQGD